MADLQGIYNRLNSGSQYTPLSAETFGDWSMEAGDLITVTKDGQSYASPVMIAGTDWRGAGTVTVESARNREREPLSVLSRKKFSGGGGGYWNSKKAFTRIDQNDTNIEIEARARERDDRELSGRIEVQAGRIDLVADESTGKVTPASIMLAINEDTSIVRIAANKIVLDGEAVAESLATQYIRCNGIESWGTCEFKDGVTFENDVTVYEGITCNLHGTEVYMNVADVEKSLDGKTLTITYVDGTSTTFSKAVTLSGAWSNGTYSVSTTPNVGSESTTLVQLSGVGEVENLANGIVRQYQDVLYQGSSENPQTTGAILRASIDASGAKNPINMPTAQIYTTSGSPPSGSTQASTLKTRIQQAIADNDTVVFRIDCGGSQKYYHMSF